MTALPFTELAPGVAIGTPPPTSWRSIGDLSLAIIVGVTGVGKSTTLGKLAKVDLPHTLLPNRRDLTDRLIIATFQALDGAPIRPVTDRRQRFEYTRRYRSRFPGGMSHALTQLWIDRAQTFGLLIFDGLRGIEEVGHAVEQLPQAHFIVLHAPDVVRVQRLLVRQDAFDRVEAQQATPASPHVANFAALGVPEASAIFTKQEEATLLGLVGRGAASPDDLRAKLQIVVEERRNYDPQAAITLLQAQAPARSLIIDTTQAWPDQVVEQIVKKVSDWKIG